MKRTEEQGSCDRMLMEPSSITELLSALCDCSLVGVSWKRRSLGAISRESFHRRLKKRAYGALLSSLFHHPTNGLVPKPSPASSTPPRNKVLMICFDLRVAGCQEEAELLEERLALLSEGPSSPLKELDAVLELLVLLAGSVSPPHTSFSRDYMRRERAVLRKPPPWSYQSEELQRLEARAWGLVCGEEWGALHSVWGAQRRTDAPPGGGMLAGRSRWEEERFEKETRLTLFGALQHSRSSDMEVRLDLPPVPRDVDLTGLTIRVPSCSDQCEDEGFLSASNLTPDSQSESSPRPALDLWEAVRTFEPERWRCWETVGWPPGGRDSLYVTEAGREAFDHLYRLWEGELRIVGVDTPSPLIPLPLDSQSQLVSDLLHVLVGVESTTFTLNHQSVQFDVRPGVCVSGASPESVSLLLGELAQYGTHYLRLSHFSLHSSRKKGLVFQAFTGGLRKYLHYYQACVLSTPPTLSLLTISFLFRKVGRQLRYLCELCCVDGGPASFPVGVALLSYLYSEAQSNSSNENYPVLLSLLRSSCEPYTRFVSDWVYSGVFRDVYREFMIQVNQEYLGCRDRLFWVEGYSLISMEVEECVPVFLRHMANDVYVCGKTINLLKICCPQHYICWSDLSPPRIAVTFSLQEVEQIEQDCAVYQARMEQVAKHSATSRKQQALRAELARQELISQVQHSVVQTLDNIRGRQASQRLADEAEKRKRFEEQKQQMEQEMERRSAFKRKEQEEDFTFVKELKERRSRLGALEEQLEQRARKDLIDQYGRLSEEAARRERRALWRAQRIRLQEARLDFFMQDRKKQEALDKERPPTDVLPPGDSSQQTALGPTDPQTPQDGDPEAECSPGGPSEPLLVSDVTAFPPTPPQPDSQQVGVACGPCPTGLLVDYDFSAPLRPLEGMAGLRPCWGPSSAAISETMPLTQNRVLSQSTEGGGTTGMEESDDGGLCQQLLSESRGPAPNALAPHASHSHIRVGENVSEVVALHPAQNVHGHASHSNIRVGENVSDVIITLPSPNVHGHSSDAHLGVGSSLSEGEIPRPSPNVHGHASHSHIRVGENVSDVIITLPSPNVHGHSSDAHLRVGGSPSDGDTPFRPTPNVHGHASDSHIRVGGFISEVTEVRPLRSAHGNASDCSLQLAWVPPGDKVNPPPVPTGGYPHSSDSCLGVGCVVSGADPPPPAPLPGSAYGHSSDSTLGVGCVVSGEEPPRPALPGSAHGHSSDSALGVGCVVKSSSGDQQGGGQVGDPDGSQQEGAEPSEKEQAYLSALCEHYQVERYQDCYQLMECQLWRTVSRGVQPPSPPTAVPLNEMVSLPVLIKHSVTAPLITHVSLVNKAVVDFFFVELRVEQHFQALRHFLLMEDGEFAQSLSDRLFEKLGGGGRTAGDLLTPLRLNSILSKAFQFSSHRDSPQAANFTFALRFLPETLHPLAPDALSCLELRYKVDWPLNIIITDGCINKYNRLFSFLLQLKHMVWSLHDVWFTLKRTALVKGASHSLQFRQLQLYRHEMQHFVKVIQGYISNQILQVSWSEFTAKLAAASNLDAIHRTHADYLNRAIFRALLTEKAAPVMNIIHSIFSLILKFRAQLIALPWSSQQGEAVHPSFIAMQQSYNTFKYYSHFLFKVVTKLVNRGYQPHLEDFLLRINFNNYYKDS